MKFRTEYTPQKSNLTLDPSRPIALIGSCFAGNIAEKMKECLWPVFSDAGTLYNPLSIARVLELLIFAPVADHSQREAAAYLPRTIIGSIFKSEDYFHSWLFDSHFSGKTVDNCCEKIDVMRKKFLAFLQDAQTLVVTFGTAWCYFLNGREDYVVANCHKMPQSMFTRRRASAEEISDLWISLCGRLKNKFPDLNFIFTISPVRHLKDGFEGNARSKATLVLAVENIIENVADSLYFPAYEIINDDLRDYRFYASDLVHPSDLAVEYIWEIFQSTFLSPHGCRILKDRNKIYKFQNHRIIKN